MGKKSKPTKSGNKGTRVNIWIPTELYERAKKITERTGTPLAHPARKAVEAWVEKAEKEDE